MPVLSSNIFNIYFGNSEVIAVHDCNNVIWPIGYAITLTPTWTYGGDYNLSSIPARGGSAYATWTLTAVRTGRTLYTSTVTPTSVTISDTSNFSYNISSGEWHANDRGSNGYSSSTTRPTEAQMDSPARSCTLNARYVGTIVINGQSIPVDIQAETVTLTQNRNQGSYISNWNTYDNYSVWLDNYYDSSHQAPACKAVTNANGSCRCGNCISWSSDSTEYYYETLGTLFFSFSSSSDWIQIDDDEITVASRGKISGGQRYATINGRLNPNYYPNASTTVPVTLYQSENRSYTLAASCSSFSITGYKINGSTIPEIRSCTQTTVTCTFKATWSESGTKWTAYYDGYGDPNAIDPGTLHVDDTTITPSSILDVAGASSTTTTTFTVSNTHTLSKKTWSIEATYLDREANGYIQQVSDSKTYGATKDFSITISKSNDTISARGGSATLTLYAWHSKFDYWNSGGINDVVYDSTERVNDYASASVNSGGTRFSLSSRSTGTDSSGYRYSTYTVTHGDMTNNETTDSVEYIASNDTQNPSSRPTVSFSARNRKTYGTPVFVAKYNNSIITSVEAYSYDIILEVTCPITWTSLYPDPGLTTSDFRLSITSKANDGYRGYSEISSVGEMTFGSLNKNERSAGTTSFRAENSHTSDATLSLTEKKNGPGNGTVISDTYGPKVTDNTYQEYDYSNYSLSISLSRYNSSSSAAPFGAATYNNILSYSASGHKERTITEWHQDHTIVKKYVWDSRAEDIVTTYPTETGSDEGSWGNVSDTPTIVPAQSWLTVSGNNVTVGANSGLDRSCSIQARVTRRDTGTNITASTTFYQKKYVSLTVSQSSIIFTADAGTATFTVTYSNVSFQITHSGAGTDDPITQITPTTGGNALSSGSTTITVKVSENSSTDKQADIIVSDTDGEGLSCTIDVWQYGFIQGSLDGYVDAIWGYSNTSIDCEWVLQNTNNVQKKVNLTIYVYSTDSQLVDPDHGVSSLVQSSSVGQVTVAAGSLSQASTASGNKVLYFARNANKTYWVAIKGTGVTYHWSQIEENS